MSWIACEWMQKHLVVEEPDNCGLCCRSSLDSPEDADAFDEHP